MHRHSNRCYCLCVERTTLGKVQLQTHPVPEPSWLTGVHATADGAVHYGEWL